LADIDCDIDNPNVKECNSEAILTASEIIVEQTEKSNTNEALIIEAITDTNTLLQEIKDELDVELVYTSATKTNNGTANFYSREKITFDSETNAELTRVSEYSTD